MFQPMIARDLLPGDRDREFDPLMRSTAACGLQALGTRGAMLGASITVVQTTGKMISYQHWMIFLHTTFMNSYLIC